MKESKAKHRNPPKVVPTELAGRLFKCEKCGSEQPIDWFAKQPFPSESIASDVSVGFWIPISFFNKCACTHLNSIEIERKDTLGRMVISADESFRQLDYIYMFLYAGCGIAGDKRAGIQSKITALEKRLARDSGGLLKSFHAKSIMSSKSWPQATRAKRLEYIREMCKIAKSKYVLRFVTTGSLYTTRATAKEMKLLRDRVFSAYTIRTLERCTNGGVAPTFAFDQAQNGSKNGWAEECMIGIRRSPLFIWFTRGAHVPAIEHVAPGSTIESKLADCIAFVTAREFDCRISGKNIDVDTQWYGYSQFSGFNSQTDLIYNDGVGFPWRHVFGMKNKR